MATNARLPPCLWQIPSGHTLTLFMLHALCHLLHLPIEFMVEDTEAQPEVTKKELKSWWEGGGEGGGIQPFLCPLALRSPPLSLVSCVSFDLVSPPRFARPSRVPRVNTGAGERVMSPVGPARAGVLREGRWTDADCEW